MNIDHHEHSYMDTERANLRRLRIALLLKLAAAGVMIVGAYLLWRNL